MSTRFGTGRHVQRVRPVAILGPLTDGEQPPAGTRWCRECDGNGFLVADPGDPQMAEDFPCPACGGQCAVELLTAVAADGPTESFRTRVLAREAAEIHLLRTRSERPGAGMPPAA